MGTPPLGCRKLFRAAGQIVRKGHPGQIAQGGGNCAKGSFCHVLFFFFFFLTKKLIPPSASLQNFHYHPLLGNLVIQKWVPLPLTRNSEQSLTTILNLSVISCHGLVKLNYQSCGHPPMGMIIIMCSTFADTVTR